MKILSTIDDDVWHELGASSYEWWYFDAISEDGYGLVITFFYGLPFSPYYNRAISETGSSAHPGNHCAFYLCLYGRRATACYALNEHTGTQFNAAKDRPEVAIGGCAMAYRDRAFRISIDAPARFGRRVTGALTFRPELRPDIGRDDVNGDHVWNCVAPRCQVSGNLSISGLLANKSLSFTGLGYHDHNYGVRPMHHDMLRWHWGRLHTASSTSIYYIVENQTGASESLLAVFDNDGRTRYCGQADYQARRKRHFMGVNYYPAIDIGAALPARLTVANRRAVDKGPFYLRFLAEQELQLDGAESVKAIGFAEAFEPARLFIKAYWPFVKMRIRKIG